MKADNRRMPREMLHVVLDCYPELDVQCSRVIDAGHVNTILILNETMVFRFPKTPSGVDQLLTELTVLRALHGQTILPVPELIYTCVASRTVGEVFAGHRMVPGEPLGKHVEALKVRPPAHLDGIADGLANFMRQMHHVPIPPDGGLPAHDAGRRQSVPLLREHAREKWSRKRESG